MKAIVLCGGLGTRLGELTRETPKPLIPVAGRPFLSYVLDRLVEGGASELVLAVSFQWEKIRALYGSQWRGVPVAYSVEPQPLGTGGAIRHAMRSHEIEEAIVVNGDTLLDLDAGALAAFARDKAADVAMALKYMADTSRFGRVEIDQAARVLGFREKGVGQAGLINSGVYHVHARVFADSTDAAFSFELDVLAGKLDTAAIYGMQTDAYFIDMGVPEDLARAQYELPLPRRDVAGEARAMMDLSMPVEEFKAYMGQQLDRFFPDRYAFAGADVDAAFDEALQRLEYCLKFVSIRGFVVDGKVQLSHLHSGQYCHLLYFMGNSLWKRSQNQALCDKLMLLNQALNGVFCSYKLALPEIFFLNHPVGSVLGHAQYSNFLVILQNVTVNTDPELKIGECVALTAGAQIIGNKPIGARSSIGANTLVFDREIPADSVVYNGPTGLVIRPRGRESLAERYFNVPSA